MAHPDGPIEGGLYVTKSENSFGILKVLKFEDEIVHVRTYKNKFKDVPGQVDPSTLSLGTIHDKEGFGIGHLPMSLETFNSWRPQFLQHALVEAEELEGYEAWTESKGGVWE